jgi:predicted dehydrogenase
VVPDPNHFDGDVKLRSLGGEDWEVLPVSAGYVDSARGYGLHDLARTPAGSEPRAGGELAFHVLEVMESVLESAALGQSVKVASRCERPEAVPLTDLGG